MDHFEERPEATQSSVVAADGAAQASTARLKNRTDGSRATPEGDNGRRASGNARPFLFKKARALVFALVVGLVAVGLAFHTGTGTPSSFGLDAVAALCPLGGLEAMLGAHEIMLHPVLLLAAMLGAIAVLGKAFCAWICPAPWLQRLIRPGKRKAPATGCTPPPCTHADNRRCPTCALDPVGGARDGMRFDTRHATLLGALGATAVFGFPVFCLVCPIGLTFATFIGLWHLFQFNETSWGLVVFPVILVLEVVFLRKWCAKICPVSALVSLVARANHTLRPRVRREACLRTSGVDCHMCVDTCPEQVDPHSSRIPECSKCGACVEACPAGAIDIKLLPRV